MSASRLVPTRPRVLLSLVIGIVTPALLTASMRPVPCALIGWNTAAWTYLILALWRMGRATPLDVRRVAELEDESATVVLALVSVAAVASLVAVVVELTAVRHLGSHEALMSYLLTVATVLSAWIVIPTLFALHYARCYYADPSKPSLEFPESQLIPDYWDFLYFSVTVAVALQTSDISLRSRAVRRAVLVQSVLSFFFNMTVLGLFINIAAGLLGQ